MKKTILFINLFFITQFTFSQVFWTETFGTGCNQAQSAIGFNSGNGLWSITSTVLNQSFSDFWYVSGVASTYYLTPDNGSLACSTCFNTTAQPTVTTQYIVTGYNSPHCYRRDTITVNIDNVCDDFFVPHVFSPNGDGLNETANVHGLCISTFNLQLYNRWGEKVFDTTDKTTGWDGTFKGKILNTSVFVYKVNGVTLDGKPFLIKGNVTLLR